MEGTETLPTFANCGFLSPDIRVWIEKHRKANQDWFALADALNRVAMSQIPLVNVPDGDNQAFLTAVLFGRCLTAFQGAIILAERGMTAEARTLVRSCFEAVFCLGAVRKDSNFADAFIADDASRRRKIANALLKLPDGLEAPDLEKLSNFVDHQKKSDVKIEDLSIARAAKLAGLEGIYDTYYRGLSNDAAHPSVTALNRHVEADKSGTIVALRWGPEVADVDNTLLAACTAAVYMVFLAGEMLSNENVTKRFENCWAEYKRLVGLSTGKEAIRTATT